MKITPTELKLIKESAIAEYKFKNQKKEVKKTRVYQVLVKRLRKLLPINIIVGVIACIVLVYLNGWKMLGYLFLSGIIWLTLITSLVSAFLGRK